jgi:hypothetical protein
MLNFPEIHHSSFIIQHFTTGTFPRKRYEAARAAEDRNQCPDYYWEKNWV